MPRKRKMANLKEQGMGLQGTTEQGVAKAFDFFTNLAARTGFATPSLTESTEYNMVRLSYNYWELITLYRNHWITRRIVDTPAQDMVRAWPKVTSDIDPEDVGRLDKAVRRTGTRGQLLRTLQWARLFGGAGALIVIDGQENELDEPLDLDKVEIGAYRGLLPFDRWAGITPDLDICTDITRPLEFNKPEYYRVHINGGDMFRVHSSRILRFTGPLVPTPEYEAQTWWGISVIEPAYEEIRKRDNMSWNILALSYRANILGMKIPDLAQIMSGVGASQGQNARFEQRMSQINHLLSNQSLVPLPADGGIESTQYSFAGLSDVYQQFQLDISGATQIPVTRLWGRTISGLGQSNDADERIYEEKIASDQEQDLRPQLEQLYPVICMSELGEVPKDIELNFPSVRVLDEKEKSELAKTIVDTVVVLLNSGIISQRTAAQEVKQSSDYTNLGTNITDEDIKKLSDDVQPEGEIGQGLFGEEGAETLTPAESPKEALKEETKKAKGKAKDEDGAGQARTVAGFDVVIETPKGDTRTGPGWETVMPADYGYIVGYPGADGDSVDCYVGPSEDSDAVYVVDQRRLDKPSRFDEHKVCLGFNTRNQALDTYMRGHHKSAKVFGAITPMTLDGFRSWLKTADLTLPCSSRVRK